MAAAPPPERRPEEAARIHARLLKTPTSYDRSTYNRLITLYSGDKSSLPDALRLFNRLPFPPTVVSWTAIISAHSQDPFSAFQLFLSMLRRHSLPNQRTVASLLAAFAAFPGAILSTATAQLHSLSLKLNLSRSPFAGTSIVSAYCRARRPSDALKAFDEIAVKDEVCYAAAIVGLAQNRRPAEALSLFAAMRAGGAETTMYSLSAALRAAADMAALEQTRMIHAHAVVMGLDENVAVGTALIDAYGKTGLATEARRAFCVLGENANLVAWNAILSAHALQGDLENAHDMFDGMLRKGFKPDEYTFLALLTACGNEGMVADAEKWIDEMGLSYGVAPGIEHYTCLVGAMARAGRLKEAELFAREKMPFRADAAVWRTLLAGCAAHGDAGLAQTVCRRLLEANPEDDSAYVMLANVYAAAGKREETAELWSMMRYRGVKKESGRSWVEVRGEVHEFLAGDRRHARVTEIYKKVEELMLEVERMGCEAAGKREFWHHSERLAVACALVVGGAAGGGKMLRVVKNVRICGDCHEVFGFLSRILGKEIIVRDANRYHRFEGGLCSCKGLW